MAAEDRDRLFEKALARELRSEADATGDSACLDAETLAAYHERMLAPDEMILARSHLVKCARCQEILAQLEATHGVQESLEPKADEVPQAAASAPLPGAKPGSRKIAAFPGRKSSWLRWAAPAGAVAAGILIWAGMRDYRAARSPKYSGTEIAENRNDAPPLPGAGKSTRPKEESSAAPREEADQKQSLRSSDSLALRDEAPAPQATSRLQEHSNAVYGTPLPAPPRPDAKKSAPRTAAGEAGDSNRFQAGAGGGVGGGVAPKKDDLDTADADKSYSYASQAGCGREKSENKARAAAAAAPVVPVPPPPPPTSAAAKAASPSPTAGSGEIHGRVTDPSGAAVAGASVALKSEQGSTVASTSTDNTGAYSLDGVAAGNYQLELQSAGFQMENITGLNVAAGDNIVDAKLQVGTASQTVQVTAEAAEITTEATTRTARQKDRKQLAINGRNFTALAALQAVAAAPDGRNIWRFGEHGEIAHSGDGGSAWESQVSQVTAALRGGSATSKKVCWIAGASGTLLRTADGGKHWQIVTTPITGDLGGVHARDAKHATIWDSGNQTRYETSDGGVTWQRVANPQ